MNVLAPFCGLPNKKKVFTDIVFFCFKGLVPGANLQYLNGSI
jgi:hypothetical protein